MHYVDMILDWAVIALLSFIVGWIGSKLKTSLKKDSARDEMVFQVGKSMLRRDCERCLEKGHITTEELASIEGLYKAYKDLGGNGVIKELYDRCVKLPIGTGIGKD